MNRLAKTWTVTWKIALFLVLWGALLAPGVLLTSSGTGGDPGPGLGPAERLPLELLGALAVVLAAWVMARFADRRPFLSLGFRPRGGIRDALIGLVLGAAMILLAVAALWLAGWARFVPAPTFSWSVLGIMGGALLFNSVTQEVLVRGYVLQTLEAEFDTPIAVIASSIFFVLLHAGALAEGGFLPGVNLLAAGVLLGLAYTTTRNLWLPIALHFSWNFHQGPVLGIAVTGQALDGGWRMLALDGPAILTGGAMGLEGGLIATLSTLAGTGALLATQRRRRGR